MKKTDIAMIILIASVSVLIAFFVTKSLFGGQINKEVKVKTIESVTTDIVEPNKTIFNGNSINPAVEVQIDARS